MEEGVVVLVQCRSDIFVRVGELTRPISSRYISSVGISPSIHAWAKSILCRVDFGFFQFGGVCSI